jgi:hypothetical protein
VNETWSFPKYTNEAVRRLWGVPVYLEGPHPDDLETPGDPIPEGPEEPTTDPIEEEPA